MFSLFIYSRAVFENCVNMMANSAGLGAFKICSNEMTELSSLLSKHKCHTVDNANIKQVIYFFEAI